jgi:hypothetical protein
VAEGDGAAVLVDALVVVRDAVVVEEGQHLHGEGLVDLEQTDVGDRQTRLGEGLLRGRDRAVAHDLGLDTREGVGHEPHLDRQVVLAGEVLGGDDRGGRTVVQTGRVSGRDPPVHAERRLQTRQVLQGGPRAHRLVGGDETPTGLAALRVGPAHRDRHQVGLDLAVGVRLGGLLLRAHRVLVRAQLGDLRVAVVQVLRGHAHEQRRLVDQLLGDEPRVRVHALAHRVAAHVLDTAGDGDVVRAEGHGTGDRRDGGQGAGAHAVDGVAGHGGRQAREDARGTADGQTLVTDLRGRGDGDLVDLLGVKTGVAAQQLPDRLHDEVVGTGLVVDALRARLAERGTDAVDEDDIPDGTRHDWLSSRVRDGTAACAERALRPMLLAGNVTAQSRGPERRTSHPSHCEEGQPVCPFSCGGHDRPVVSVTAVKSCPPQGLRLERSHPCSTLSTI